MTADPELERWNERFAAQGYHFGTEPSVFVAAQAARLKPGMKALCVADGEGRNGVFLARQGLAVTSFDFSPVAVEKAKRLAASHGVPLDARRCSLDDWDWDAAQYDAVVASFIQFATPPERAHAFAGFCRALAPGGLLLLQGYRPEQLAYNTGGPRKADQLYTAKMLKDAFAALQIIELREHDSEVQEGRGHSGMSALIDLVARRPAA
jgi:SAM-dependent methyltransferase